MRCLTEANFPKVHSAMSDRSKLPQGAQCDVWQCPQGHQEGTHSQAAHDVSADASLAPLPFSKMLPEHPHPERLLPLLQVGAP